MLLSREIPLPYVAGGLGVVILAAVGAGYFYYTLADELATLKSDFASSTTAYETQVTDLSARLAIAEGTNSNLNSQLRDEQDRNNEYGKKVESLVSSVSMLEKLSKTDRELLQKYSNVYFLSENFVPAPLATIDPQYLFRKDVEFQIHASIKPHLDRLIHNATADGAPILVLSAYRSFGTQAGLKTSYKLTYGAGTANQFSADQGYSEHQLGSTVDFTTPQGGSELGLFEKSSAFTWLQQHAHEYGFILSYPKGNGYFTFEPWHWRFVGVELATRLKNENKSFYDLDQRTINEYLVKIFD
jgi:LAS superfamily LD-carboxypeptidase LdcB